MGYDTDFDGEITITPPLNDAEIAYLNRFSDSRRTHRRTGPYAIFITSGNHYEPDPDAIDHNRESPEQPSLWCQWVPDDAGTTLAWSGAEKFHEGEEWMRYLIDTFLRPGATLAGELANPVPGRWYAPEFAQFTFDHVLNGTIEADGEDPDDRWNLVVTDNVVTVEYW